MAVKDYYMTAQLFQYDNPPDGAGLFPNCGRANDYIENPLTFFWFASFSHTIWAGQNSGFRAADDYQYET